jgi:uncharacterized membrane protein YidH (DUF202 family)
VDRAYRASTRAISVVTFLLGVTMIIVAVARGGGVLAVGVVIGILFMIYGAIRYRQATRAGV